MLLYPLEYLCLKMYFINSLLCPALFQFSSVAQSCLTLCDLMDCSTSGLPVHHQLPEFTQTHVHWVGGAIQPSHPLSSPSPLAFNLSQPRVFSFFYLFIFIYLFIYICGGFCHTLKWNSHGFTCVPHPDPPSHLPLHPLPLGFPSAPGPSACLIHPTWAGDLFHPR